MTRSRWPTLSNRWRALATTQPFFRLVEHFGKRAVGASDTASPMDLGLGGTLAILAVPGAFSAILLFQKYSSLLNWVLGHPNFDPYRASPQDEYFFIVFSMCITVLVAVLRWDHLLPGRRDFLNLAPLPVKLRTIFLANVAAIAGTALLFGIDVNAISSLLFPAIIVLYGQGGSFGELARVFIAHVSAVMGVSLFSMSALLGLQGLLMALLPDTLYRKVSLIARAGLLVLGTAVLISAFVFPLHAVTRLISIGKANVWWPPLWFLSLFESQLPRLRSLATVSGWLAVGATLGAVSLAAIGFTLSYRRYFLRISERQEGPSRRRSSRMDLAGWAARSVAWRDDQRAVVRFAINTLTRNETHLLFLGLWIGIGVLLAVETWTSGSPARAGAPTAEAILSAPLTVAYMLIAGLRFIFVIPAALEANWIFRMSTAVGNGLGEGACRRTMALLLILVFCIWAPLAVLYQGWFFASLGLTMHVLVLIMGVDLAILNLPIIPFTCLFSATRDGILRLILVTVTVLAIVIPILVRLELLVIRKPWKLALFSASVALLKWWLDRGRENRPAGTVWETPGVEPFALLRLSAD